MTHISSFGTQNAVFNQFDESDFIVPLDCTNKLARVSRKECIKKNAFFLEPPLKNGGIDEEKHLEMFFLHVYEERGKLLMFGKLECGKSICINIKNPIRVLYFYPIDNNDTLFLKEIEYIVEKNNGKILSISKEQMEYYFSDFGIPRKGVWYKIELLNVFMSRKIPKKGKYYQICIGSNSTLTENFLLSSGIKGPQWITLWPFEYMNNQDWGSIEYYYSIHLSNKDPNIIPPLSIAIFSIATVNHSNSQRIALLSIKRIVICDGKVQDHEFVKSLILYPDSVSLKIDRPDCEVFDSERNLLLSFLSTIHKLDCDFISSYNLISSDLNYLISRCIINDVQHNYYCGRVKKPSYFNHRRMKVYKFISGRIPIDIRNTCREHFQLVSDDFSSVVKQELSLKRQQIDNIDLKEEFLELSRINNLINFVLRDTQFVRLIIEKIELIPLSIEISRISGCELSKVLKGFPSLRCESLLVFSFYENRIIIPDHSKPKNDSNDQSFRGASVLPPKRGFYNSIILLLDFKSLYPSIIQEFDICFSTLSDDNVNHNNSILPNIMKKLVSMRNEVKTKMTNNQSQRNKILLDIKQRAIKKLSNSIYGYLAYRGSRFPSRELAALISEKGREILTNSVDIVERIGLYTIIYGDTDSLMINTGEKDIDRAIALGKTICDMINAQYKYISIGIENIFSKVLLMNKKKYATLKVDSDGKNMIIVKGIDLVRRDWCYLSKYLCKNIIALFLCEDNIKIVKESILYELSRIIYMLDNNGENNDKSETNPEILTQITPDMLIIYRQLNKCISEYKDKKNHPHVTIAEKIIQKGGKVPLHATIPFIVGKKRVRELFQKVLLPNEVISINDADIHWYKTNQLFPPIWRLCDVFGGFEMDSISKSLNIYVCDTNTAGKSFNFIKSIPHIRNISFNCEYCHQSIEMKNNVISLLKCSFCRNWHNWKLVTNKVIIFIKELLINQSINQLMIFNTIRFYIDALKFKTLLSEDDEDFEDFRRSLNKYCQKIYLSSIYSNLDFRSLIDIS